MLRLRSLSIAFVVVACGCAVGDNAGDDGVVVHHDGGGDARDSGTSIVDSGEPSIDSGAASDSGARFDTAVADSGSIMDTGSTIDTGSSIDTGTGADTGADGGTTCTAPTKAECSSSATAMTNVSGDTGSDVSTAAGADGEWLRIYVTEDDSSIFSSKDLHVRVTLTSPPGENFDLYVYEGPLAGDGGGVECTTVAGSSTTSGVDVVNLTWTDEHPIGGHDDSRNLSIEVRPVSATCDASAKWTVKVEGDT